MEQMQGQSLTVNWGRILSLLPMLVLLVPFLMLAPAPGGVARAQPVLLMMAAEQPEATVGVIVQKAVRDAHVEDLVAELGGKVTKDLHIINAFAAELPAGVVPELARAEGVRWVSLDAPVIKVGAIRSASEQGLIASPGEPLLSDGNTQTVRDEFNATSYSGSDGTRPWSSDWQESGESDGPRSGRVQVRYGSRCADGNCLRIDGDETSTTGRGASRQADLSGATSATLTFSYRRQRFGYSYYYSYSGGSVSVQVSADGGSSWTTLTTYDFNHNDSDQTAQSFDITPYIAANTTIRFIWSGRRVEGYIYVDNVEIAYATDAGSAPMPEPTPPPTPDSESGDPETVRDEFNATSYSGSDGTRPWSSDWQELGESDGPRSGQVRVRYGSRCADGNCLRIDGDEASIAGRGASRQADLSGATTATLSFSYRRDIGNDEGGSVSVQVSADGGSSWTTLATYDFNRGDRGQVAQSFDITPYIAANTTIRFIWSGREVEGYIYVDNVEIAYVTGAGSAPTPEPTPVPPPPEPTPSPPPGLTEMVRDEFNATSFGGNDGTVNWASNWVEDDPRHGGAGPSAGQVQIVDGELRLDDNPDTFRQPSAARAVDLSGGVTSATFSFNYRTASGVDWDDAVVVEVSGNGGASYSVLETFTRISGATSGSRSYDISAFISDNTMIRFRVSNGYGGSYEYFFADNVQIAYPCVECLDSMHLLNAFVQTIGADRLWNEVPEWWSRPEAEKVRLQGKGVTVAVVDSGIADHNDLKKLTGSKYRIKAEVQFLSDGPASPDDYYGHGSFVAGIIGGNAAASGGAYFGVAPDVEFVDVKVIDDQGIGTTSDVVAGLQWILDNKDKYDIQVVNLSLNSTVAESYHTSPLDAAVEILWFNGMVVMISAGNNGGADSGILYPPANDPFVITVGATDDRGTADLGDDVLAPFSAYGVTESGFAKPDLVAPGTNLISLLASDKCNLAVAHPANIVTDADGTTYFRMSGTSMAAAVATGAVALLLQDEPNLNPDQVKYRLMATVNQGWPGYDPAKAGAGYLDAYAAVHGTTTETTNTGIAVSNLLTTGPNGVLGPTVNWGSVNWGSVNWGSVNWGSVNWGSVNWGSVNWSSVNWDSDQ